MGGRAKFQTVEAVGVCKAGRFQGAGLSAYFNGTPPAGKTFYVDGSTGSDSYDGLGTTSAKATLQGAIDACTSGRGDKIVVRPGFYYVTSGITLTKNDVAIVAEGRPEDTVFFGCGTSSPLTASDFDLITITGVNNLISGLALFTYKNTKSAIVFDDTGGAATAGFNVIANCVFSPQAADGQNYGIEFKGGSVNWIINNVFEATKTAGIRIMGQTGNPARNIIQGNKFLGTNYGVSVGSANYETLIDGNVFAPGSQSGYNMAKGLYVEAGMNAGDITYCNNIFNVASGNVIDDSSAGGTINAADKLNNYYLA